MNCTGRWWLRGRANAAFVSRCPLAGSTTQLVRAHEGNAAFASSFLKLVVQLSQLVGADVMMRSWLKAAQAGSVPVHSMSPSQAGAGVADQSRLGWLEAHAETVPVWMTLMLILLPAWRRTRQVRPRRQQEERSAQMMVQAMPGLANMSQKLAGGSCFATMVTKCC